MKFEISLIGMGNLNSYTEGPLLEDCTYTVLNTFKSWRGASELKRVATPPSNTKQK
jgi:hypothetical protein